jgi:hypothetical protein
MAPIVLVTAANPDRVEGATVACRADGAILKPFAIGPAEVGGVEERHREVEQDQVGGRRTRRCVK